jgi:hypothetical protein
MIIDKEEHRDLLRQVVEGITVHGPAVSPEVIQQINLVHELRAAIEAATIGAPVKPSAPRRNRAKSPSAKAGADAAQAMLSSRGD